MSEEHALQRVYDKIDTLGKETSAAIGEVARDTAVIKTKMTAVEIATEKNTKEIFGNGSPGLKAKVYRLMMIVTIGGAILTAAIGGISVATMTRLVAPASITGPAE